MSAYTSNRRQIKDALVYILSQVTYDHLGNGPGPLFSVCTADPSASYSKEPTCIVLRAPTLDTKGAVGEQDHCVGFQILILLSLENKQRTRIATQDWMDDLEELTLKTLDEADWTDAINHVPSPPSTPPWKTEVPNVNQYVGVAQSGRLLICCIDVKVDYTIDL